MTQANIVGQTTHVVTTASGRLINYPSVIAGINNINLTSKDLDMGHPSKDKYVDYVQLDLEAPEGKAVDLFFVQIGIRDNLREEITWLDRQRVDLDNPAISIRQTARFFVFRIIDELPLARWKLSRIEFYGRVMGGRR